MVLTVPIIKLGLIRFATSLLVVLLANVLNRVLVVELHVPATLVTFSFAFQHVMTPVGLVSGYLSDRAVLGGRRRLPYILVGMALSLAVMPLFPGWAASWGANPASAVILSEGIFLFAIFGIGTTISATAINAVLVDQVPEAHRGGALAFVWILTLSGFIVGSALVQGVLPTYDPDRLRQVFWLVTLGVLILTVWGAWGVEPRRPARAAIAVNAGLRPVIGLVRRNPQALLFFAFLAASVYFLAIQTFILTVFGGEALGLTLAETSRFGIYTTYGTLIGMLGLYLLQQIRRPLGSRTILSLALVLGALAFGLLSFIARTADLRLLMASLWLLGLAKGLYNIGISYLTMGLVHPAFGGVFMGLWNLISGLALAAGEMTGGWLRDQVANFTGDLALAYGVVFLVEGVGLLGCLGILAVLDRRRYWQRLRELAAAPASCLVPWLNLLPTTDPPESE